MTTMSCDRRALLCAAGGAALLAGLPLGPLLAADGGDDWAAAFDAALARDPSLVGWAGHGVERDVPTVAVSGVWPADLRGAFYRNGPGSQTVGGRRYRHWFDGDGLVHRWGIGDGRVSYRARYVATRKRTAEAAAGRPLVGAFGTRWADVASAPPDAMNPANISVLPLAGKLLALWEVGSAYDLDPDTLATAGERVWRRDLAGMPFSAHPKTDPDGTVWNFGVDYPNGRMVVWQVGADGAVRRCGAIAERHPGMLHDMAVTGRHILFLLAPYTIDPDRWGAAAFLDTHRWHPDAPLRAVAVDKDTLAVVRRWELPAGFGFHFGNAWEEADGTIRCDFCLAPDAGLVDRTLRLVMRGERAESAPPRSTLITLYPDGRTAVEPLSAGLAEFPRVDPRVVGRRNRALFHLERRSDGTGPWLGSVVRRDMETGAVERFDHPPGIIAEEMTVIPRPGSGGEGDGWLLGTVLAVGETADRSRTGLLLFDAAHVSAGPVAEAWLDTPLPLGFHGAFAPV